MPPEPQTASGFLNLYKPVGPGSQSLLGRVRRLAGTRRVGHGGTLDPFASGVLPIAVGRATRLIDRLHAFPKTYRAEIRLGIETTTGDLEGDVIARKSRGLPPPQEVAGVVSRFQGAMEQTPPAFSAVRVGGRRAYEVARAGESADLAARTVHIYSISVSGCVGERLTIEVTCSSGTYIRVLGQDIAVALGTTGHLSRLVRTAVGPFDIAGSVTLEELEAAARGAEPGPETGGGPLRSLLEPPDILLTEVAAVALDLDQAAAISSGRRIGVARAVEVGAWVRAYDVDGGLLGLLMGGDLPDGGLAPRLLLK